MPHDVSIDHPIGCRGGLFHADRGQVQELCEDLRGHRLDVLALALGEPAAGARELAVPDLLGQSAQRRDRGHNVERCLPVTEAVGLVRDEPLGPCGLGSPPGDRLGDDGLEIVDVVEEAAVELVDRRIQVARNRARTMAVAQIRMSAIARFVAT